jgi:hypothetical protein
MELNEEKNDSGIALKTLTSSVMYWDSLDELLDKTEVFLRDRGYKKYKQNYKNEDFAYWKSFYINDVKAYQVAVLFYDYRKYNNAFIDCNRIGLQFECMISNIDSRIDLSVSKDVTIEVFEDMSRKFYESMIEYQD